MSLEDREDVAIERRRRRGAWRLKRGGARAPKRRPTRRHSDQSSKKPVRSHCPVGLFVGTSVETPQATLVVFPVLLSTTYHVPFDGRQTAKSVLLSPS